MNRAPDPAGMAGSTGRRWRRLAAAAALLVLAAGCRQGMFNQEKYKPLAASEFFPDGASARPLPEHTVARGFLEADRAYYTGMDADLQPVAELPVPLTRELLARGRERFNIFCSPCHGETGDGDGMIVRRGYKRPPSYHIARLRAMPVGYFFTVASDGMGQMPAYREQVPPADRWAIAAYIRALQLSQHARLAELPAEDRRALESAAAQPADETARSDEP